MPKPKTTLGQRPIADDENVKIKAFLEEDNVQTEQIEILEFNRKNQLPRQSPKISNQHEEPFSPKINPLTTAVPGNVATTITQLLQNGEALTHDGMVKRNFSVSRNNMNSIKRAVQLASNAGVKKTQDDVLNEILEDWFKSHGW